MMRALLLRHREQLSAGRPQHPWPTQGCALPHALWMLEELPLRTSGATASPTIIDADPISVVPGGAEDLVRDQPQIDLAPGGLETSGAQVPPSSSSSPRFPRHTINWNHTPWQEDWFEDNEDMQALWTSIITINNARTVSVPWHVACLLDRT
jgi:hypothetical protein